MSTVKGGVTGSTAGNATATEGRCAAFSARFKLIPFEMQRATRMYYQH